MSGPDEDEVEVMLAVELRLEHEREEEICGALADRMRGSGDRDTKGAAATGIGGRKGSSKGWLSTWVMEGRRAGLS